LPANLSPFGGVNVPFTFVNGVSGANPLGVTVQLTDGTNTATGSGQLTTNGAQTLLIDPSAFGGSLAGLDLTAITGIRFRFNASENNDFTIGPISIVIVPEPLAILGASTVLLVGLAGWRFAGRGLRRAD
jgi:hypothetical protein